MSLSFHNISVPKGTVTFQRQCILPDKFPDWANMETTLTDLHVAAEGTIEDDGDGLLQVGFHGNNTYRFTCGS